MKGAVLAGKALADDLVLPPIRTASGCPPHRQDKSSGQRRQRSFADVTLRLDVAMISFPLSHWSFEPHHQRTASDVPDAATTPSQ